MTHWDLIPGETVTLVSHGARVVAVFRGRDTHSAFFELDDERFTLELSREGHLNHPSGRRWNIVGENRSSARNLEELRSLGSWSGIPPTAHARIGGW